MRRVRVIPVLLIKNGGLVKSVKFKNHKYVGDPINAVRIFNEKEVDEIIVLDIFASAEKRKPDFKLVAEVAGEAFMPMGYGGGLSNIEDVKTILNSGIEKAIFNFSAIHNEKLISETARQFGSSSTVVSMDIKKDWLGRSRVFEVNGSKSTGVDPVEFALKMVNLGAGELFVNSIDRDGTYAGYDIEMLSRISEKVEVPVVACGGASGLSDFREAIVSGGCSAVAAGSMFVFQRPHQAVLISYPSENELIQKVYSLL